MNNNKKDISVIFINYKTEKLTIAAINSVIEKTEGLDYEIFVVDNNSQDGSIEAIEREFPDINIIKNPINAGFGAANNLAIKQAIGKYILCLNTDTLFINNALKEFFDFMESDETVGVCGGNLYDEDLKPAMSYSKFPNFWNCQSFSWLLKKVFPVLRNHKELKSAKEVDFISGADIVFRKSVLDEVGLFDEQFFMYCEETDLCLRIKKAGYKIKAIPAPKIIHYHEKSSSNFWNNIKLRVKSKYLYARKNQSFLDLYAMKFSYVLLHLLCFIFTFNKNHFELMKMHLKG